LFIDLPRGTNPARVSLLYYLTGSSSRLPTDFGKLERYFSYRFVKFCVSRVDLLHEQVGQDQRHFPIQFSTAMLIVVTPVLIVGSSTGAAVAVPEAAAPAFSRENCSLLISRPACYDRLQA
jgi:hypothetical protein